MSRRRFLVPALLLLSAAGCSSFTNVIPAGAIPARPAPDRRFQVWVGGEHFEFHAVRVGADTLSGVRYWQAPNCDSCRVAFPLPAIDSVRTLAFDGGETGILTVLLIPVILLLYIGSRIPYT